MKILSVFFLSVTLLGCGQPKEETTQQARIDESDALTGSFRMGNREIREEMYQELEKHEVEYWINDDGSIGYNLSDGKAIDVLGYDVINAYIRAN
ncbi:MAG: hypothetical protein HOF74_14050 [Gammaproteobacteria bacterium]|jgi:hypothetical protein|nr:hypothetical protein [Gammaproteobacteria bacterium]MBT3860951.1 hypothetical protein [Gammaproteobacteria bacterium]MBT3988474.1 hypothetical protein [Gammaproteobacteria bacterium]MBT4256189.1 hypothetical protein [Gammaproteobacteria bacterium]MBT4581324.1 hypothetical protein [Gammaproteobacteria bacterium]